MAHIEKRVHTTNDGRRRVYWRAQVKSPGGQRYSKQFARAVDAQNWAKETEADLLRGDWVDPAQGRRLFGELAAEWQGAQLHRDTTVALVASDLRNHILPTFGKRPVAGIRHSEVQAWVKRTSAVLAPTTVERVYRWLAAIFRMAVRDGVIKRSPCQDVKLPKKLEGKVVPLLTEEVEALLTALPVRYRALAIVGLGAGLRQGEAFGLTVPRIDFLRHRSLEVMQQLKLLTGRPPFLAVPKTPSSVREVPVGDVVLNALARHLELFPPTCELESVDGGMEPLVFSDGVGGPIRRTSFSAKVWLPARRQAGLPETVTFHDLRHYYASLLIHRGASVKVVQSRLGHKSAVETLNVYSHLWPDDEDLTRQAVDDILAPAVPLLTGDAPPPSHDLASTVAPTPAT